ncbi:uncharacterized protein BX663DRAFT_491147 [Cokeromyces recurvatus]|uniref:uncharacterized protein n=1 Tax=Cokeromyces recurvatus TaxID=90255 RepID=UPI00221F88DD|nr:uncharacterized protein BX663DRAFT_491147 [Cokeromyces recurvatus]KAI7907521.1 hypothetical protein BX663DRAFT_491147 [Cokeromyces recurvatus]
MDELLKKAKELMATKDKIEEQLNELEDVLNSAGIDMNEPLVDTSGFPRAEIDVYNVRNTRSLIHRLRNDHRATMSDIEKILHKIHEVKKKEQESSTVENNINVNNNNSEINKDVTERLVAFAKVNAVAPDSPAYTAGLRRNDHILKFGHINSNNHERLQALNVLVSQSENRPVPLTILRDGQNLNLVVTPRSGWGGRGTLGCHILPL